MTEKLLKSPEPNSPQLDQIIKLAIKYLRKINCDLALCLGDSVAEVAEQLRRYGINTLWLNHNQGHALYQTGTADDQTNFLTKIAGHYQKPVIVEDTMVSGGKMWQLRNTFQAAGIHFQAVVLAAEKDLADTGIHLISSDPKIISELRTRVSRFINSRNNLF